MIFERKKYLDELIAGRETRGLVAVMAQKRNRSVVVWVLLSLLATPLLMIVILLAIGKNENYNENHYDRE